MSDADQLREEIEQTRADLARTVDALSAKLDVKAQAQHRAAELKAKAEPYRVQLAAGAGALVVVFVALKVRGRRNHAVRR
jgi:Protein of unknown function (DUF3618)